MSNNDYSVALCTYNGADYIEEQLHTIINQTLPPTEIIICDDCSTDNTVSVVKSVLSQSDIPYSIVINKHRKGVTNNFCNAISLCSCPVIFTSDQDDVWMENKAEKMMETFHQNENAKLVFSNGYLVDENLEYLGSDLWSAVRITRKMIKEAKWFDYLLNRSLITGAAMALKKELFNPSDTIPVFWYHDAWFAFKASLNNEIAACNNKLIKYRQHRHNVAGMPYYSLTKRIRFYLGNIKNGKVVAERNQQVWESIKKQFFETMTDRQREKINQILLFWNNRVKLFCEKKLTVRIKLIIYHLLNGDYKRYSHGFYSAMRDLLLCFVS